MGALRISRVVAIVSVLSLVPVAGVANAQTAPTCPGATGTLTTQQQSLVNDYEILVNKANSRHTAVPVMPDEVAVLIGCISPASQLPPGFSATAGATGTGATTPSSSSSSSSSSASSTAPATSSIVCPTNGLSAAQESLINDYEILVARANSRHTAVPPVPDDVAALIACG